MPKKAKTLAAIGSETADEIFLLVGSSLSYWEASEDVLMGVFKWLCADLEPVAFQSYLHAPRKVRISMIRLALSTYKHRFLEKELIDIEQSITSLDKLAPLRNEIAHGNVSYIENNHFKADGSLESTAKGNYLVPGHNEGDIGKEDFRFNHTAETIFSFREKVRDHRWLIFTTHLNAMSREQQEDLSVGPEIATKRMICSDISARRVRAEDIQKYMRPLKDWSAN